MTTVTLQDVSAWTDREGAYLYLVGATKAATRNLLFWVFFPFLLAMSFLVAQLFPFRALKAVRKINAVLPEIQNDEVLCLIHDLYQLIYKAGSFYSRLCLFRGTMQRALEEVDETLDSLSFVLSNQDELDRFLEVGESRQKPNLPLPLERAIG